MVGSIFMASKFGLSFSFSPATIAVADNGDVLRCFHLGAEQAKAEDGA